jgi:hypothetical protein
MDFSSSGLLGFVAISLHGEHSEIWCTPAAWATAVATGLLVLGVFWARGAYLTDQVVRLARELTDAHYYERFWNVEMHVRGHVLVRSPSVGLSLITDLSEAGDLPVRKIPSGHSSEQQSELNGKNLWTLILRDMLGPGFSADGSRADMIAFRWLMLKVAFWAGIGRVRFRRWYQRRRVKMLLRVLGPQLVDTVYRHRWLASHMVLLRRDELDSSGFSPSVADFHYYPDAYGVLDDHYGRLAELIVEVAAKREFGSTMRASVEKLRKLEQSIATATATGDWPSTVPSVA